MFPQKNLAGKGLSCKTGPCICNDGLGDDLVQDCGISSTSAMENNIVLQ